MKNFSVNFLLCLMLIILLGLALFSMPYGYYQFLKVFTFSASIALFFNKEVKKILNDYSISLIIIAVLFNPLVEVSLKRSVWSILNILGIIYFSFLIYKLNSNNTIGIKKINIADINLKFLKMNELMLMTKTVLSQSGQIILLSFLTFIFNLIFYSVVYGLLAQANELKASDVAQNIIFKTFGMTFLGTVSLVFISANGMTKSLKEKIKPYLLVFFLISIYGIVYIVSAFYLSITLAENLSINNLIEIGKNAFLIIGIKMVFSFVWNIFEIYLIYIITKKVCKIFNINFSNSRIFSVRGNSIEVSNQFGNETSKTDEKSDLIKHKEDLDFIASKNENIFLKLMNSILALKNDTIKNEIVHNRIKEIYEFVAHKNFSSQEFEILFKKSKKYEVKESEAVDLLKKMNIDDKNLIIKSLFKVILVDMNYFGKKDLAMVSLIGDTYGLKDDELMKIFKEVMSEQSNS